jgi:small ligand-binding sensory domain FIST
MTRSTAMRFASAASVRVDPKAAVQEVVASLEGPASPPDLVLVFAAPHHAPAFDKLGGWLREALGDTLIVGACASGVIGAGVELEEREGLSVTAAWLPDTRVRAIHVRSLPRDPREFPARFGMKPSAAPHLLILADGGSCETDVLLRGLDAAFPNSTKLGGVVGRSGVPSFFVGGEVFADGALVCAIEGACKLDTIVAQGCRPIGEPFIVTRCRNNIIDQFNAGKPTDVLRTLHESLSDRDKRLFDSALLIGVEMGNKGGRYAAGDFLVRDVLGVDRERGAMAIATKVSEYQVVQFHLRDREAAEADLVRQLRKSTVGDGKPPAGAVLFSCVGRGERLFGVPNHDSHVFLERSGAMSLSGAFCGGEIGPVGGKTFLHGYTSVFGVFSEP